MNAVARGREGERTAAQLATTAAASHGVKIPEFLVMPYVARRKPLAGMHPRDGGDGRSKSIATDLASTGMYAINNAAMR